MSLFQRDMLTPLNPKLNPTCSSRMMPAVSFLVLTWPEAQRLGQFMLHTTGLGIYRVCGLCFPKLGWRPAPAPPAERRTHTENTLNPKPLNYYRNAPCLEAMKLNFEPSLRVKTNPSTRNLGLGVQHTPDQWTQYITRSFQRYGLLSDQNILLVVEQAVFGCLQPHSDLFKPTTQIYAATWSGPSRPHGQESL